jgi:hypothetical protein
VSRSSLNFPSIVVWPDGAPDLRYTQASMAFTTHCAPTALSSHYREKDPVPLLRFIMVPSRHLLSFPTNSCFLWKKIVDGRCSMHCWCVTLIRQREVHSMCMENSPFIFMWVHFFSIVHASPTWPAGPRHQRLRGSSPVCIYLITRHCNFCVCRFVRSR